MQDMKTIQSILRLNKDYLKQKYGVLRLGIFGSYARGEENNASDIDILVETDPPLGLEFIDLAEELEFILGHRVDLVSSGAPKANYLEVIEKEIIYV